MEQNYNKNILLAEYAKEDFKLRCKQIKISIILAILLFTLFGVLDWTIYQQQFWDLTKIRLIFDAVFLAVLAVIISTKILKYIKTIGVISALIASFALSWMIMITEGVASPYYAGLNLTIVVMSVLLPWTVKETTLVCLGSILFYAIACFIYATTYNAEAFNWAIFSNNMFFLIATSIICIVASHYQTLRRFETFRLNFKLDQQNVNLEQTMDELKVAQTQLVHTEKLNAVGTMAAGLLHEVNNPLNYTITAAQILKREPMITKNATTKEMLDDIIEGMDRIKLITTDLHTFAHPSEANKQQIFPLIDALNSAIRFTAHERNGIPVKINITEGLMAQGSQSNIVQVFINLVSNAVKALKKKADAYIQISAKIKSIAGVDRVVICVRDNGEGMNNITKARVFEPFFTTREVGDGLGMGLSVCHTIIKNHDGKLSVQSKLGQFTEFSFDLSVAPKQEQ